MKNGYTPKEYAYSIAVDALQGAINNVGGALESLTASEKEKAIEQFQKLRVQLADKVKLDIL